MVRIRLAILRTTFLSHQIFKITMQKQFERGYCLMAIILFVFKQIQVEDVVGLFKCEEVICFSMKHTL